MNACRVLVLGLCLAALAGAAEAGNWPQWRGPNFDGSAEEDGLPARFSRTENVAWKVRLAGVGGATPIVHGDRVFMSSMDPDSKRTFAECYDRDDGRRLWRHEIGRGFTNHQGNTAASPSPVTDGERVWFLYGTGDLVAFKSGGTQLWRRNIQKDHGPFEILWDYGASPLLWDGKLYVPVIHGSHRSGPEPGGGKSYLLCIDPATGRDLWKRPRPSDAGKEAKQAYTTPVPMRRGRETLLLLLGGDHLTAHEAATGREVWRSPDYNPRDAKYYRTVASPVVAGGVILISSPRGGDLFALTPGAAKWAWTKPGAPDVPTPLAWNGKFYVLNGKRKRVTCIEPRTGRVLGETELPASAVFQASPTGADGKIYLLNLAGEVFVLEASPSLKLLHRTDLGGTGCRATVAAGAGQLFIRTDDELYCFGERKN